MKSIIIILSVVALCYAQGSRKDGEKGKRGPPKGGMMAGCNMTNFPKGVDCRQCCPSKPRSLNPATVDVCKTNCSSIEDRAEKACCWSKCIIKESGVFNPDGSLNQKAAIDKLRNSTTNVAAWESIIKSIVEKCVADAPAMAKAFMNRTNRTDTCGDANNKALAHCVSRELFVQCPEKEKNKTNTDCEKLFEFAKSCPAYPFGRHGKRGKGGKGGKGGKRGENGERMEGEKNGRQKDAKNGANSASANRQSNNKGGPSTNNNKANSGSKPAEKRN